MKLLYAHEHIACINYQPAKSALIEVLLFSVGEHPQSTSKEDKLIFMLEGSMEFSFGEYQDRQIDAGKALMIPANYTLTARVQEHCRILVIRLAEPVALCDCFSLEKLLEACPPDYVYSLSYLGVNDVLQNYLTQLAFCIDKELLCARFLKLKIEELFLLLRAFYSKQDLLDFFYLQLTGDMAFSRQVNSYYLKAKNARELAAMLNYSYSGFIKRFNRVFQRPPYQWMKERKAHLIYHDINTTAKSMHEISQEYGFSSQGRFSDFCKQEFGILPKEIRLNRKKGNNPENIGNYE